jgi:hypothetical protein
VLLPHLLPSAGPLGHTCPCACTWVWVWVWGGGRDKQGRMIEQRALWGPFICGMAGGAAGHGDEGTLGACNGVWARESRDGCSMNIQHASRHLASSSSPLSAGIIPHPATHVSMHTARPPEPFRLAESNAVNDRCVVEFVAYDSILRSQQCFEQPRVGVKA